MDDIPAFPAHKETPGPHLGAFVEGFQAKLDAVAGFLRAGLDAGAVCLLVIPGGSFDLWAKSLTSQHIEQGPPEAVTFIAAADWLPPRGINSIRLARRLFKRIEESRAAGRKLMIAIDMAWVLDTDTPVDKVCHWEATCDHMLEPERDVGLLCVFDVNELPCSLLHAGLRTHNELSVFGRELPNPFFEAQEILRQEPDLNECSDDPEVVGGMLRYFANVA
jgi:hypothetical protein